MNGPLPRRNLSISPLALLCALALAGCAGDGGSGSTPSPTATSLPTSTSTPTVTASATATPTFTASATRTDTTTPTPTPTSTATATPSLTPAPTESILRLSPLHAEPDPVNGGRIVDAEGRTVLLRGVNVNAFAEYWQGTDFPTTFPLTAADADMMAAIGWNAVRLLLTWSRVEPAPGDYDDVYLTQIEDAVHLLESRGIYSIIDLHQDAWGATLVARDDEVCAPPMEKAFGWDGAPGWATLDGGAARCVIAGIRETSPAVRTAFQSFWNDTPAALGVGVRTLYARMLGHLAGRFAGEPAVAGFDVMNEPNAFPPEEQQALSDLYGDALREIRAAEEAAEDRPHLLFFEPSALWSAFGSGAPPDFERDRDVVYSPHVYTGGLDSRPLTAEAFQIAIDEAKGFGGAPVFCGEWGSDPRRASDPEDQYFRTHQALQDQFRISATLWTWRESCGDPHKASDYRAGRVPYVWGEFDVDCATNAVTGVRQDLVDQLTRGWVRAAPGKLVELRYDPDTGLLTARGTDAPADAQIVAFYPVSRHGSPTIHGEGLMQAEQLPAAGGNAYISLRTIGGEWRLEVGGMATPFKSSYVVK